MLKKALSWFLIFNILIFLCACRQKPSCSYLMTKTLAVSGEDTDGNGSLYFSEAVEGDLEYFSDGLRDIMYGDSSKERYFEKIEDFAIFVSQRTAGELAIFRCYSSSDTDLIVEMCLRRADKIKVALRTTEYEEKSKGIIVRVYRDLVVFYFVEEPRKAENRLSGLI